MSALVQGTQEWLEFRKDKIGASDAVTIMGVSPWSTPANLWEEKLGLRNSPAMNSGMKRGHDLEEEARIQYQSMTGYLMTTDVKVHPKISYMIASLDGIDIDGKMIVEIKCPNKEDHALAKKGKIPDKYYPQVQHQMEVTGLDGMHYFSFDGSDGVLVEVERDQAYIKEMIIKEREFYRCLKDFECPALTEKDFVERNDEIWLETAQNFRKVADQIKGLETRKDELREALIAMCQKRNTKGGGVKVSRSIRRGSLDAEKLAMDFDIRPETLEKYRKKATESWRVT
jgi:putative phage-type endonuclease